MKRQKTASRNRGCPIVSRLQKENDELKKRIAILRGEAAVMEDRVMLLKLRLKGKIT